MQDYYTAEIHTIDAIQDGFGGWQFNDRCKIADDIIIPEKKLTQHGIATLLRKLGFTSHPDYYGKTRVVDEYPLYIVELRRNSRPVMTLRVEEQPVGRGE